MKVTTSLRGQIARPAAELNALLRGLRGYTKSDQFFEDELLIEDINRACALIHEIMVALGEEAA